MIRPVRVTESHCSRRLRTDVCRDHEQVLVLSALRLNDDSEDGDGYDRTSLDYADGCVPRAINIGAGVVPPYRKCPVERCLLPGQQENAVEKRMSTSPMGLIILLFLDFPNLLPVVIREIQMLHLS